MPNRVISFFQMTGAARASPDTGGFGAERLAAKPLFSRHLNAGVYETRAALRDLVQALGSAGLDAEMIDNTELILAEVLNNIAEHAYVDGEGPVAVQVMCQRDGLVCEVSDRGRALTSGVLPDPALPKIAPPDHLPEGGFGWHIIRSLACDLSYRRDGGANRLVFRIPCA